MNRINKLVGTSVACVAAFLFIAGRVSATNLIVNPGFESGLTPWTYSGAGANANGTVAFGLNGPSALGSSCAAMSNFDTSTTLSLQQSTSPGSVVPGTVSYSFDVRNSSFSGGSFAYEIYSVPASGPATDLGPGTSPSYNDSIWHTLSGSVTVPANVDHLTIEFDCIAGASPSSGEDLFIDNVSITQVPEPTTVTLASLGVVGTVAFGRKRKL